MIRIAICDDMQNQVAVISEFIEEYIGINELNAQVSKFTKPDSLLIECETEKFDIYILDIVMPMFNGIEVGKEIRKIDREAQIIYVSTEASFALESFSAGPINYLLKPVDKGKFFETLTHAISEVDTKEEQIITIETKEGLRVLRFSSIISCEYINHAVWYKLMDGDTIKTRTIRGNFQNHVEPLLLDERFIQPHSSFVINMSRIEIFAKDHFVMRLGGIIPIPKKKYSFAKDRYMDYLLGKEGC